MSPNSQAPSPIMGWLSKARDMRSAALQPPMAPTPTDMGPQMPQPIQYSPLQTAQMNAQMSPVAQALSNQRLGGHF